MIIQELKPSKRVRGRWLAVLEDGSLLRVGEGEVLQFSLCAGPGADGGGGGAPPGRCPHRRAEREGPESAGWPPHVPPGAGAEAGELGGCSGGGGRHLRPLLEELGFLNDASYAEQVVRHYSAKGYGLRKLRDELYRRGCPGNCGMRPWTGRRIRRKPSTLSWLKSWETRRRRTDGRGNGCRTPWPGEAMPGATSARACAAMVRRPVLRSRRRRKGEIPDHTGAAVFEKEENPPVLRTSRFCERGQGALLHKRGKEEGVWQSFLTKTG